MSKTHWKLLILLTIQIILVPPSTGKNFLFFFGICTYSHRLGMWPLIQKLAGQGHNITIFSGHPPRALADPKIHEIVPQSLVNFNRDYLSGSLLERRLIDVSEIHALWDSFSEATIIAYEMLAKDPQFWEWFDKAQFDIVFMDALFSELALGLAFKFNAPLITFSTTVPYVWQLDAFGAKPESWLPDMIYGVSENGMSFLERFLNIWNPVRWHLKRKFSYLPNLERILRHNLNIQNMPPLEELERNISLNLINSHYSEDYARSLPPNVVSIGGLQCFEPIKNNQDNEKLMKFMDKSLNFVYISLGSASKVSHLPPNLKKIFLNSMHNLKTNFVLQWEGQVPNDMPKNVFASAWLPQQIVLDHPKIKAFVTHGGLLGLQEAVCAGVPLIVIPVFAEQDYNGNRVVNRGRGIKLEWKTLTQNKLEEAINQMLTNPSYKQKMEVTSKLFKDRPISPIDLAVWHIDYILRHGQVEVMKPLGIHQTFYERRDLDVWFLVFSLFFIFIILIFKSSLFFCRFLSKMVLTSSKEIGGKSTKNKVGKVKRK